MADAEELDEDLFADLYEGDDTPAKPAQAPAAPPPKVEEPVPAQPPTVVESAPEPAHSGDYDATGTPQVSAGDMAVDTSGWNGNGNGDQSYDHGGADQEDNYGPINVKEDGWMPLRGGPLILTPDNMRKVPHDGPVGTMH